MGKQYHQLTENKIAEILSVHRSTIYRELKRNCLDPQGNIVEIQNWEK